jgi:hypothetical protein
VLVLIVQWSADSRQLLIHVTPGETECVDCDDRGDWKERKAAYGYFVYNLERATLREIKLPKDFDVAGFFNDGRLVGTIRRDSDVAAFVMPDGKTEAVKPLAGANVSTLQLSPDGSWLVAALNRSHSSQIVRADLNSGVVTELTPEGEYTQFQGPGISPEGRHVSWTQRTGAPNSGTTDLMVDNQRVFTCPGNGIPYEWLDEKRIAIFCNENVQVVNSMR